MCKVWTHRSLELVPNRHSQCKLRLKMWRYDVLSVVEPATFFILLSPVGDQMSKTSNQVCTMIIAAETTLKRPSHCPLWHSGMQTGLLILFQSLTYENYFTLCYSWLCTSLVTIQYVISYDFSKTKLSVGTVTHVKICNNITMTECIPECYESVGSSCREGLFVRLNCIFYDFVQVYVSVQQNTTVMTAPLRLERLWVTGCTSPTSVLPFYWRH